MANLSILLTFGVLVKVGAWEKYVVKIAIQINYALAPMAQNVDTAQLRLLPTKSDYWKRSVDGNSWDLIKAIAVLEMGYNAYSLRFSVCFPDQSLGCYPSL